LLSTTSLGTTDIKALVPERNCETKSGFSPEEGLEDYVERSVRAGPVLFGNAATLHKIDAKLLAPRARGQYSAIKIPVTVAAGHSAVVEIAVPARAWAALIYDTASFADTYSLEDGTPAAVFVACEDNDTFFNGGFIVTAPGCLELKITAGEDSIVVEFPIGPSDCAEA
jgi:hypothetical protein